MPDGDPYRPVVADRDVHAKGVSFLDETALQICGRILGNMVGAPMDELIDKADEIADVSYTVAEAMVRRKAR
mgnify:CR=1 FL=1